jgi:uncharacterized repeat protein (TIGR01451 family)
LTVANAGPNTANGVVVTDTLPAGVTFISATPSQAGESCTQSGGLITCNLNSIASGASETVAIIVRASTAGPITNSAFVTTSSGDNNTGNNSDTETTTVNVGTDLSVSKSDSSDPVAPGGQITYTIQILNNGPNAAQAVALVDTVPAGTTFASLTQTGGPTFGCTTPSVGGTGSVNCSIATLVSGASATFSLVVNVSAAASPGSQIGNTASVSSTTPDFEAANNSDIETTQVSGTSQGDGDCRAKTKKGTLKITCDNNNNVVRISDDGQGNIEVVADGLNDVFGGIDEIVVKTKKGNDQVTYDLLGDLDSDRRVKIDLGKDDNVASINVDERLLQGDLDIEVKGDKGTADITALIDAILSDGARFSMSLLGQSGSDSIDAAVDLSGNGRARVLLKGNDDDDLLNLDFDVQGNLNADAEIDGGSGTDTCTSSGDVNLRKCE